MNGRPSIEFHFSIRDYARSAYLWITTGHEQRMRSVASPAVLTFNPVSQSADDPPTMELRQEEAQSLFDAMWRAGMRPSGQQHPEEVAAVRSHLADMRAIAFAKIEVEKP